MSDSLKDVEDLSLGFSVEADFKLNGELDAATKQKKLIETVTQMASHNGNANVTYSPGRRQMLFAVAIDCYNSNGEGTQNFQEIIKKVMKAAASSLGLGKISFVLLTGSSLNETMDALKSCPINIEDFDAIICNSGSELYHPWKDMVADAEYEARVEYKWPGEDVRSTVMRLVRVEDGAEDDKVENFKASSSRCHFYNIKTGSKVRKIDDLCQRLWMRGFRCNLVYTQAATRLNVIPLFASKMQSLRYLSIKWGINLSKVAVINSEKGDTDYEDMLAGLHKTIVMKGCVEEGSEKLLRNEENFKREDLVPSGSPNISFVEENCKASDISTALEAMGIK